MEPHERDERLEIEALERLIAARAAGKDHDDLDAFARLDADRAAAATRAREAAALVSTKPEPPEFPPAEAQSASAGRFGPFRLVREIGRGGQGEVWLADDMRLKRPVALKILHSGVAAGDDALLRFRREAEVASRLDHPGLCTVYEVGRDQGRAWMSMRFVEGETISRRFADRAGPPVDRAGLEGWIRLVEEIARAIHAVHDAGVLHRDLKPSNVMITKDGTPVVLDFGLARDEHSGGATLTAPGAIFGTPAYMAPEQLLGQAAVDRRVDVHALGAILYQAVTARLPREGPSFEAVRALVQVPITPARRFNPAVTRALEVVIATALTPDLGRRYRTALDFAEDLRRVRTLEPIRARPAGPVVRLLSWARRNRALATSLVALLVALAVGLGASIHYGLAQERALVERDQVADIRGVRARLDEEPRLWPIGPSLVPRCTSWLMETRRLLGRVELHDAARRALRLQASTAGPSDAPRYSREADTYYDEVLTELLGLLARLRTRQALVEQRLASSQSFLERSTGGEHANEWTRCIETVRASPRYGGLVLTPQPGLVPLGENAKSGLFEFWHVETGARPPFDPSGETAAMKAGCGLTLVLVPGGTFRMGASEGDPWFDRYYEVPPHDVTLAPYFISKYEMTQDQWMRLAEGRNPSYYFPLTKRGTPKTNEGMGITTLHPVEYVSWIDAREILGHVSLQLPTESQWERACRGGTDTAWSCGREPRDVEGFANIAGIENTNAISRRIKPPFDDLCFLHAPVGSFAPNPFGLYDCHGNVAEWCEDLLVREYGTAPPRAGDGLRTPEEPDRNRILRGGSMQEDITHSRVSARNFQPEDLASRDLGVRPAKRIE